MSMSMSLSVTRASSRQRWVAGGAVSSAGSGSGRVSSLPETAYPCPRVACSKNGRNGPCGGSHDGICEWDDKPCFWARAYQRMKYYGESEHMLDGPALTCRS